MQTTGGATTLRSRNRGRGAWIWRAFSGANALEAARGRILPFAEFGTLPHDSLPPSPRRAIVPGVLHAHTTYSDGRGSVPVVARAAREAGARFAILADHDTLQPLRDGWEGYHSDLLVLVGTELRTEAGYVLALGLPPDFVADGSAGQLLADIREAGGIAFAALPAHPSVGWEDWSHHGLAGLEILNLHSLSRHAASVTALPRFLWLLATDHRLEACRMFALRPRRELAQWDRLLARGRAVGLASADAHGHVRVGRRHVEFPSYAQSFQMVQTHLVIERGLTGCAFEDRETVLGALRLGRCRMVYQQHGPAEGLQFYFSGGGAVATEGEDVEWCPGGVLVARSAAPRTLFRLIHNGRQVGSAEGCAAVFPAPQPGTYRLEADVFTRKAGGLRVDVRPWVFTNPIYLHTAVAPCLPNSSRGV